MRNRCKILSGDHRYRGQNEKDLAGKRILGKVDQITDKQNDLLGSASAYIDTNILG